MNNTYQTNTNMKMTDDRKQELIVRQAQLNTAIEYFKLIEKKPSIVDLVKVSTMLEQFIYNGYSTKFIDEKLTKVDEHISEIK
jgi:hypothetical protein